MNNSPDTPKKRIRIAWAINGKEGKGLPVPPDQRKTLQDWCERENKKYGPGSHWIEEVKV